MDNTLFLQHLREGSLEVGCAFIEAQRDGLRDHTAIADLLAEEALKQLFNPFLSLKLAELLIYFGEITEHTYARALGLKAKGDALLQIRHHKAAITCLDQAGALFLSLGDERNWARSRISWIVVAASLGRVEEALQHAAHAREIFSRLEEMYWVCIIDHNTAWVYSQMGQYRSALGLYERMLAIYPTLKDQSETFIRRSTAIAQVNQSVNLSWLGELEQAYRIQLQAQASFVELNEIGNVVNAEINLANLDYTRGYFGSALRRYYQAQDILLENGIDNPKMVAEIKLQIANVLIKLNRTEQACQLGYEAIELSKQSGTSLHTMNMLREYAATLAASGRLKEALVAFDEAKELFTHAKLHHHASITQLNHAELLLEMGESSEAFHEAQSLVEYFETQRLVARLARAHLVMAGSLIEQAQSANMRLEPGQQDSLLQKAILLCRQASLVARQHHLQEDVYKSQYLMGRVFALRGDAVKAMKHYGAAIAQIERMLDDLVFDLSPSFLHTAWNVYEDIIALYLRDGQNERAFSYLERARSMALRQYLHTSKNLFGDEKEVPGEYSSSEFQMKRALLLRIQGDLKMWQDRYRSYSALLSQVDTSASPSVERSVIETELQQCEAKLNELFERLYLQQATMSLTPGAQKRKQARSPFDIAQLRQNLSSNQLLLAYFLYKEKLVIFALNNSRLVACEIPDGMKQLKRLLPLLHAHLQQKGWANPQKPPLQAMRVMLNKLYQLVIAPVQEFLPEPLGQLTIVPYGPLHTLPFHALYDGARYLIEHFEINYLPASNMLPAPMPAANTEQVPYKAPLILGYSGHGQLHRAVDEAKKLATLLEGRCYLEEEATIARLIEEAPGSPVIHLATHGQSRLDAPNFSAVLLADGRFNAIDAFSLDLQHCELVTLSGCETGLALTGGGDEQSGLGRAFLAAGARTLVMSLWPVDDHATNELMQLFYQYLLDGNGKALALHRAQCAFIRQSDAIYIHPYYWAAFRLVGDVGPLQFRTMKAPSQIHEMQS